MNLSQIVKIYEFPIEGGGCVITLQKCSNHLWSPDKVKIVEVSRARGAANLQFQVNTW